MFRAKLRLTALTFKFFVLECAPDGVLDQVTISKQHRIRTNLGIVFADVNSRLNMQKAGRFVT